MAEWLENHVAKTMVLEVTEQVEGAVGTHSGGT